MTNGKDEGIVRNEEAATVDRGGEISLPFGKCEGRAAPPPSGSKTLAKKEEKGHPKVPFGPTGGGC